MRYYLLRAQSFVWHRGSHSWKLGNTESSNVASSEKASLLDVISSSAPCLQRLQPWRRTCLSLWGGISIPCMQAYISSHTKFPQGKGCDYTAFCPPTQGSEHGKGREWSPGCPNKAGRQSAWVSSTWRSTATGICGTFRLRKRDCRLPIHELLKRPGMGPCLPTANELGLMDSPWPSLTPCSNFPHSG